jgi:transposase, IS30 family
MSGADGRGPEPLTVQRERYVRLIADGVSNSEACRLVGVNRKTGTRWRYGRSIPGGEGRVLFYPPVTAPVAAVPVRGRAGDDLRPAPGR